MGLELRSQGLTITTPGSMCVVRFEGDIFLAQGVISQSLLGRGHPGESQRVENASSPRFHNLFSKLLSGRPAVKDTEQTAVLGSHHPSSTS